MRYQGGKCKIAKPISQIIDSEANNDTFVSLFCGSCAIECKLKNFKNLILNDNNYYLIELMKGVQNGYELPDHVSEEEYKYVRQHKEDNPVLTGFVGFGCSFGGVFFTMGGVYARSNDGRNYAGEAKRSLLRDIRPLQNAKFTCDDYKDVVLPDNCVVYADPPYNNTRGYGKVKFNSEEFFDYAREISKNHLMFISEQNAPDDFVSIWQKEKTRTLNINKDKYFTVTEHLFVHKCNLAMLKNEYKIVELNT